MCAERLKGPFRIFLLKKKIPFFTAICPALWGHSCDMEWRVAFKHSLVLLTPTLIHVLAQWAAGWAGPHHCSAQRCFADNRYSGPGGVCFLLR